MNSNSGPDTDLSEPVTPEENTIVQRRKKDKEETRAVKTAKIARIIERDGENCYLCQLPLDDDITIEHIIPRSKGGSSQIDNLGLAHEHCNVRKADHLLEELELPFTWDAPEVNK